MFGEDQTGDWWSERSATFGDRVAAAREAAGMTQKELARRIGVKTSTLRSWEDDLNEPRANRLTMLAGVLNVSLPWLLTGEGDGLSAPSADETGSADVGDLLKEMRTLRTEARSLAERLGQLEKRLAAAVQEGA